MNYLIRKNIPGLTSKALTEKKNGSELYMKIFIEMYRIKFKI